MRRFTSSSFLLALLSGLWQLCQVWQWQQTFMEWIIDCNMFLMWKSRKSADSIFLNRCSNCNSIPKGGVPIFQCGSGHLTCGDCSGEIRASMKCSHCDQTTQRSVLAENLIKELPIACKNKGCPRVEKEGDDMRDHEQNCFWRPSYDPSSRGSSPPTQREGEVCQSIINFRFVLHHCHWIAASVFKLWQEREHHRQCCLPLSPILPILRLPRVLHL